MSPDESKMKAPAGRLKVHVVRRPGLLQRTKSPIWSMSASETESEASPFYRRRFVWYSVPNRFRAPGPQNCPMSASEPENEAQVCHYHRPIW